LRLSEQYTVTWKQFDADRRVIELDKTKNGDARTVHLNPEALSAIESVRPAKSKPSDLIFPSTTKDFTTRAWFHRFIRR
jgi:integrase